MAETSLKKKLALHSGEFMAALLLIQPLLDVSSYFAMEVLGTTVAITALRMVMLTVVSLYGFVISDKKRVYLFCYGVIAGFWLLHMLNCFRTGYMGFVRDTGEYLRLVQFPLWTLAFLTFFHKREGLDLKAIGILAANFALILLVIGLSYLVGSPVYTYSSALREEIHIGVMGWFYNHNSQSAIVCLLAPPLLLYGIRSGKIWVFSLCAAAGFGLLYLTGTRLAYYTAVLLAIAFLVLLVLCKKPYLFCLPILGALVLLVALKGFSPMEARQRQGTNKSFAAYQEKIDAVMGEDRDFVYQEGEEIAPEVLEKIKRVYEEIYGQKGVFGEVLMEDLLERFGTDRVMEQFGYSIQPQVLNNARIRKLNAMDMVWQEQDSVTHLLGMEYSEMLIGKSIFDPENDFPALMYYTGYLGVILYVAFIAGIIGYATFAFVRKFPALLTLEFATAAMMVVLALGSAQFSGCVLRRPNVTVYFSVAVAMLYVQAERAN